MAMIYFAEPIDLDVYGGNDQTVRDLMEATLLAGGHTIYRPRWAWYGVDADSDPKTARAVVAVNTQALRRADVVVARLPDDTPTQGVPIEIEQATHRFGIPVVVVGKIGTVLKANSMVSALEDIDLLNRRVELALIDSGQSPKDYWIQYSAPTQLRVAHPGDAGIDLCALEDIKVPVGMSQFIRTGVKLRLPWNTFGWVVARSSTYSRYGLTVLPGIIDSGYTGELGINVLNCDRMESTVKAGDRLAQLLILGNLMTGFDLKRVDEADVHPPNPRGRGPNGFGSTGR